MNSNRMARPAVALVLLTSLACNLTLDSGVDEQDGPAATTALSSATATSSPAPSEPVQTTATSPSATVSAIRPGTIHQLTDSPSNDQQPAWSQDGQSMAFASDRAGNFEIYSLDLSANQVMRLTDHPAADLHPTWSPDSEWIAFESDRTGLAKVVLLRADGSGNPVILPVADSMARLGKPEWSRSTAVGDLASLTIHEHEFRGAVGLNLLSERGTWRWPVAEPLAVGGEPRDPSWPPDGERAVFVADLEQTGNQDLYIVHLTSLELTRLTDDPARDIQPHWSPDGGWIAFASDRDGDLDLYVVKIDGTGLTQLTDSPGFDGEPNWSPDGTRLAFSSSRGGNKDIYVMELNLAR